jgi:hypothetical protein
MEEKKHTPADFYYSLGLACEAICALGGAIGTICGRPDLGTASWLAAIYIRLTR